MRRLCEAGLFRRDVHGGYEITDAGRAGLAEADGGREPDMAKETDKPFIPGFETEEQAREAGRKFYEKINGRPGVEGVDFHLSRNRHERWHFEEGRAPKAAG